jgi:hypothetical protein
MKKITLFLLLAMAALAQDVTDGHAKKYNPATGTWIEAFPPGNAVQIGSIPVSDTPPTIGQILTFDGGSWVPISPGATVTVGGDLTGTATAAVVTGIRGVAVGPFTPLGGQVLMYDDTSHMYLPQTVSTDPALYGDLAGTASAATVVALNGVAISGTAPQNNYVLQYNSVNEMWTPQALPSGNPTLGGDLSGTASSGTVIKLRGYALSTSVPTAGQVMKYDGSQWGPSTPPTFNPTFVGDVSGGVSSTVVTHIQGILVSNAQPQDGQVMKYNASAGLWQAQSPNVPWSAIHRQANHLQHRYLVATLRTVTKKVFVHFLFHHQSADNTTWPLEIACWTFQNGHSGGLYGGLYEVSPSTAKSFPSRTLKTGANGGIGGRVPPPGVADRPIRSVADRRLRRLAADWGGRHRRWEDRIRGGEQGMLLQECRIDDE